MAILLIFFARPLILENVYADSYTLLENSSAISIRITGLLSNGVLVEVSLENRVPMNASIDFKPESLNFSKQGSMMLIAYDARVPEDVLMRVASVKEIEGFSNDEWLKNIELLMVFATGLVLLALETFLSKTRSKDDVIRIIENGEAPPKGSVVSEESLLSLSSKNPEAYRRVVDMVLKGELKVKRKRLKRLREVFSRIIKIVNLRRLFLL